MKQGLEKEALLSTDQVVGAALEAKNAGANFVWYGSRGGNPRTKILILYATW